MQITGYLIKATESFRGYTQSIIYADAEGVERVAYTGNPRVTSAGHVLQEATPDMLLVDYMTGRGTFKRITGEELDALQAAHIASMTTEPVPIDAERFDYLLEVLPPCRWATIAGAETFHVSERLTGDLVQWCVRFPSGECYGMTQSANISKEALADKIRKTAKAQAAAHGVKPETWARIINETEGRI